MNRRISVQFCLMTTSSSESVTRLSSQGRTGGGVSSSSQRATMSRAAASPKTKHSRRELDASRLAPCSPLSVTSPAA